VDFVNAQILWSMPVAHLPTNVLIDRNDRWFLCTYAEDYIEMFVLDTTVSVNTAENRRLGLNVFLNPASETLNLRAPLPIESYAIYDLLGNRVLDEQLATASSTYSVNIGALVSGVYVVSVRVGGCRLTSIVRKD